MSYIENYDDLGNDAKYKTIIDDQTSLNTKYSNFATAYINYFDCIAPGVSKVPPGGQYTLSGDSRNACDASFNNVQINANVDNVTSTMQSNIASAGDPKSKWIDQGDIDSSYNKVVNLRSRLDLKLQELYNTQNSIPTLNQSQLDSTVYSGILWTVLATTLIYYVFMKL